MKKILYWATKPIPVPVLNIVLTRIVGRVIKKHPRIFARMAGHHHKSFRIDPTNLPFMLVLKPQPEAPVLKAYRKSRAPDASASISGSFLKLLGMMDGRYDGDALFFTRDIRVEGDTEAIVSLRNALDDIDGSIAEETAACFGMFGRGGLALARKVSEHGE